MAMSPHLTDDDLTEFAGAPLPRVLRSPQPAGGTHACTSLRVTKQADELLGEGELVTVGHEDACLTIANRIAQPGNIRSDHWNPPGAGLDTDDAPAL